MTDDPITVWIHGLKAGDAAATEQLWYQYFQRMVALARQKLAGSPVRASDEEDLALSAFHSLCEGAAHGRFPNLSDRNSLWPLLALITARKVYKAVTRERRQKRGGGAVRAASDLGGIADTPFALDAVLSSAPTPEAIATMSEEYHRLLEALAPLDRRVVLLKLEGYTNNEIAQQMQVAPRTVERKLELVRRIWTKEISDDEEPE